MKFGDLTSFSETEIMVSLLLGNHPWLAEVSYFQGE